MSIAWNGTLDGAILRCDVCGTEKPLAIENVGEYIANGWPECCGQTMRLITKRERLAEGEGT